MKVTAKEAIDYSSISNINRLIFIDWYWLISIVIDYRFHRLSMPGLVIPQWGIYWKNEVTYSTLSKKHLQNVFWRSGRLACNFQQYSRQMIGKDDLTPKSKSSDLLQRKHIHVSGKLKIIQFLNNTCSPWQLTRVRLRPLTSFPTLILRLESNVCKPKQEFDFQAISQSAFGSWK
jgi:hypothetical protein